MATQKKANSENSKELVNLSGEEANIETKEESHEVSHEITLFAEPIYHFKYFNVTNSLFTSWFAVIILVLIAFVLRKKLQEIPKGIQNFFEVIVDGALGLCDQVTGSRELSLRIFPVAISAFFFILISNWLGIMPLGWLGAIEQGEHGLAFIPFFRGPTADINTTLAMAVTGVISANIFGVMSIGLWKTFNKYVNLKVLGEIFKKIRKEPTIVLVAPVTFFVGLIEIIGELAKVASLSFRLFGNVFAGEVLLASMAAIMAYLVPMPFLVLEIFVGIIQALIFSILLVVYFTVSAQDHDHDEEHHTENHNHNENQNKIEIKEGLQEKIFAK